MTFNFIKKEEQFALAVSVLFHILLVAFFIIYHFSINTQARPSFIEVEFGEFKSGTPAEFAKQKEEQVATRPDPSEVEPEEPQPDRPTPEQQRQATTEETSKPVDAPDQEQDIQDEEVKTPDTDKVDPEQQTEQEEQEEVTVPPKTEEAEVEQEGVESSGDEEGKKGELNAEQGSGKDTEKSAPYELKWEGDIERAPMVQPLPENEADVEATITVKFEVKPDGTIGRIIPLRKMNPELEREVMRTLRSWRFSRLPSGVPQQAQWGTITFRFVLE